MYEIEECVVTSEDGTEGGGLSLQNRARLNRFAPKLYQKISEELRGAVKIEDADVGPILEVQRDIDALHHLVSRGLLIDSSAKSRCRLSIYNSIENIKAGILARSAIGRASGSSLVLVREPI